MTANYQETNIAGTKWRRSYRVQIDNPYGGIPITTFHEEDCVSLTNVEVIKINAGNVQIAFDPSAQIPLINPWTGEPLTNIDNVQQHASHIEAYILLHSLYMQAVTARDALLTPEPEESPSSPSSPSSP